MTHCWLLFWAGLVKQPPAIVISTACFEHQSCSLSADKTNTESFRKFNNTCFVHQSHDSAHPVINRETAIAFPEVAVNPRPKFGGNVIFHIVRQFSANFSATDFIP